MARFRLYPNADQAQRLCLFGAHARLIWNLAVEQRSYSVRGSLGPGFAQQSKQLTEMRRELAWLRDVPAVVGQQALRDYWQAISKSFTTNHNLPSWRKKTSHEGFRVVYNAGIRVVDLNAKWAVVWVPKLGWIKFRKSRAVPQGCKSYRVNRDASGRWFVAFPAKPAAVEGPGVGLVMGVDRGVAVTLAYSDGTMLYAPKSTSTKEAAQALSRCKANSSRRRKAKLRLAKAHETNSARRRDWVEKVTTDLARSADLIRIEALSIASMVRSARGTTGTPGRNVRQKAGLNRSIMASGWGMFARRLEDKAPQRVEKVPAAYTSQTCSRCRHVDQNSRKSQALFCCTACGFVANADVNAACNIAAGHVARGAEKSSALKREPKLACGRVKPQDNLLGGRQRKARVAGATTTNAEVQA